MRTQVTSAALSAFAAMCTRKENADYLVRIGAVKAAVQGASPPRARRHARRAYSSGRPVAAIRAHPKSDRVAMQAVAVLGGVGSFPECVAAVVAAEAIEALASVLKQHMDDPDIALATMKALRQLLTDEKAVGRFELVRVRARTKGEDSILGASAGERLCRGAARPEQARRQP